LLRWRQIERIDCIYDPAEADDKCQQAGDGEWRGEERRKQMPGVLERYNGRDARGTRRRLRLLGQAKEFESNENELNREEEPECWSEASVDCDSVPERFDSRRGEGEEPDPDLEEQDGAENEIAGRERMPDELCYNESVEPLDLGRRSAGEKVNGASGG